MRSWQSTTVGFCLIVSTLSLPQFYHSDVAFESAKTAYIRHLQEEVETAVRAGATAEALQLEDEMEDSILRRAREAAAQDSSDPVQAAQDLQELQVDWRRDKRAVDFLSGLLGSSSGGGGGGGGGSDGGGGSGSGSILSLVGPLLGSSSGGSSGGGGGGGGEGEASAGGSDSGSILSLVGPLLGSSSGGGGGGGNGEGGDAGSGSGSILSLIGPLLGSSSGGSGGGGDGSGGSGGGSDLSSILGISNSSGGSSGGGGGDGHAGGSSAGIGGAVNGVKVGFLQDKIQLLLRLKFGIFTKILNTISGALAAASSPQHVPISELKYPDA